MNFCVLILDNDRDYARTIADRCENLEMTTMVAHSAADAIAQANLQTPDVFCLDLAKSELDGMAFCEYLSWNAETKHRPVIIMANESDVEAIRRCCPLNVTFLDKSMDGWEKIRERLESLRDRHHFV